MSRIQRVLMTGWLLGMVGGGSVAHGYSSGITSDNWATATDKGCNKCHSGSINAPTVRLTGVKTAVPGQTYLFLLEVQDNDNQAAAGFNVSASAGTLLVSGDEGVRSATNNATSRAEVTHSSPRNLDENGYTQFEFRWTAPASFTSVVLSGWGNAVSLSSGNSNDKAASTQLTIQACADGDGDGHMEASCGGDDCDDTVASAHPGSMEVCDAVDNDCNAQVDEVLCPCAYYLDDDGDGYGTTQPVQQGCEAAPPEGYSAQGGDCDDADANANPGVNETIDQCEDGIDQNCDGSDRSCTQLDGDNDGVTPDDGDCDDNNESIYPAAVELVCDGIDQDCDGFDDEDGDGDGYIGAACGGPDCVDTDGAIHPAAVEVSDGVDQNCNETVDENTETYDDDGDGQTETEGDCDDANDAVSGLAAEVCDNGVDDDCSDGDEACAPTGDDDDDSGETVTEEDSGGCDQGGQGSPAGWGLGLLGVGLLGVRRRRQV